MASRYRRVHFVHTFDQDPELYVRRTRGASRQRGRSAERVHGILDDFNEMSQGRADRGDAYEQLLRENHSLKITNRTQAEDLDNYAVRIQELEAQLKNVDLQNRELRRAVEENSESEAKKAKRKEQRKKINKLELDLTQANNALKDALDEIKLFKKENIRLQRAYEDVNNRLVRMRECADDNEEERKRLQEELDELRRGTGCFERRRRPY